jgi:hypothetical protein
MLPFVFHPLHELFEALLAADVFHGEVMGALIFTQIKHLTDILVPDFAGEFELVREARDALLLRAVILLEHPFHVLDRDMVVIPEASPEVLRDMHHFVDDRFRLVVITEVIEAFGDELQDIKGFDPHRDLQDFAHPVTAGNDPSRRRAEASDANDLIQIDVMEAQCPNDIREPGLDIVRDFIPDVP